MVARTSSSKAEKAETGGSLGVIDRSVAEAPGSVRIPVSKVKKSNGGQQRKTPTVKMWLPFNTLDVCVAQQICQIF